MLLYLLKPSRGLQRLSLVFQEIPVFFLGSLPFESVACLIVVIRSFSLWFLFLTDFSHESAYL